MQLMDSVPTPRLSGRAPVRLAAAGHALWRVLDRDGFIIGHVEARRVPQGIRYRARRLHPVSRAFLDLGEFWSADDAVECLRFAR